MTIALVLGLLVAGIILFSLEVISVDLVTLLLLLGLVLGGVLTPAEAFSGFASDILVILASIYVVSGALQLSGALDLLGRRIERLAAGSPRRFALIVSGATGLVSTVMNNTTATAVFLPPTLAAARRLRTSPSQLLIPLAYASILGGTCTLIGTSTNVAVSGAIAALGLEPLTLFELTPVGVALLAVGFLYLFTVGRRLLPVHGDGSLTDAYEIRQYLTEVVVATGSRLIGQRAFESDLSRFGYRVLEIERGPEVFLPNPDTRLAAGDHLVVQASLEQLARVEEATGLRIQAEPELDDRTLQPGKVRLAEAMVAPKSTLIGRTLNDVGLRQRFGVNALAVHRRGHSLPVKVGRMRLRPGDLLLVQGPEERMEALLRDPNLWVLEAAGPRSHPRRRRGYYAAGFLLVAMAAGGTGAVPLAIALLAAAVATVLVGAITAEEAYRFIEWRLLVLIGGMTAFGTAMAKSGAATFLAHGVVAVLGGLGPLAIFAGFAALTIALTQPMSNAAAALVVLPVAVAAALQLGANPRTFAVGIALAASISFATPLEPSCLLVYAPGKYRFLDFVKVGAPLTLLLLFVLIALVPLFWPL